MDRRTQAHRRFQDWIDQDPKARTRSAIAEALGLSQPSVSGWLGGGRPEAHWRMAIEKLTSGHVAAIDWLTPSEKRQVRRVRAMPAARRAITTESRAA